MSEVVQIHSRAKRKAQETVSIDALETCRRRLSLGTAEFAEAIGLVGRGTYQAWIRAGKAPKVYGLAAEVLVRRQAPGSDTRHWLVTLVKGVLQAKALEDLRELSLDGKVYWLVESSEAGRKDRS